MSGEGSSSIGGNSPTQSGYVGSSETLKGSQTPAQFKSSSLTEYPPLKHMPPRIELHEIKSLNEWEVETSSVENHYFQLVDQLQTPLRDTPENRKAMQDLLTSITEAGHQVITYYQVRLQEMQDQGLMDHDVGAQLSEALYSDASDVVNTLAQLEQQLGSTAPKRQWLRKNLVLPGVNEALQTVNAALQRTKDQIRANSGEDVSQSAKWEELGTQLDALNAQFNHKMANIQELESHLKESQKLVEKLMHHSARMIGRSGISDEVQRQMAQNQRKLAEYQEELQCVKLKSGLLNSAESQKRKVQKPLQGAIDIARELQTWMPTITTTNPETTSAAISPLENTTLQRLASKLKTAGSSKIREATQEDIKQFINEQQKEYNTLIPLLSIAATKQDTLGSDLVPEVSLCLGHLNALAFAGTMLTHAETEEDVSEALQKADQSLTYLEDFNSNIPDTVYYLLTQSLSAEASENEHLANLLCRSTLAGPPKRLSEKKHISALAAIEKYYVELFAPHSEVPDKHERDTFLAHRKIVGEAFSSPEWVRTLTEQAKNLEELRALSHILKNWEGLQHTLLTRTIAELETIRVDMTNPQIESGYQSLQQMTTLFDSSVKQYADAVEQERRKHLQQEISQAIEEHISHRLNNPSLLKLEYFKTTQALCNSLQKELNDQLGGVAKVSIVPAQNGENGSIKHHIDIHLDDPKETARAVNRLLHSQSAIAKDIAKKAANTSPDPLVCHDPAQDSYVWVPHPATEVQVCGQAFAKAFDNYTEGVQETLEHHKQIHRLAEARKEAEVKVDEVIQTIPDETSLPAQDQASQDATHKTLTEMKRTFQGAKSATMKKMAVAATECRNKVAIMLGQQQVSADQAQKMLTSLFELMNALDARYTAAQTAMPSGITMAPPTELMDEISRLAKPPKAALLLKIFARDRLKLFEQTKPLLEYTQSLIEICSKSHKMPLQAIKMLDELSKILRNEGLEKLGEHVKLYSDDLYLKLRQITVEQEFPELPSELRDNS